MAPGEGLIGALLAVGLVAVGLIALLQRRSGGEIPRREVVAPKAPASRPEEAPESGQPKPGPIFELGRAYTRPEIRAAVGGGLQDYLPHADGVVVCGCFNPDLNPDAPDVILPGFGPGIERWAEAFAAQKSAVPCFLKRATNCWEYVGEFRVRELSRAADEIERWSATAGREGGVSMVLHLEEVRL